MIDFHIDIGQVIISLLTGILVIVVSVVGWFVKKTITDFSKRLEKHEEVLFNMNGHIQLIMGRMGIDRRKEHRD